MIINIKGISKGKVLAALYNNSKPQGLGLSYFTPENMTEDEADEILELETQFDYLKGRVLKVDLSGDNFDSRLYDEDLGEGSAQRVIDSIIH